MEIERKYLCGKVDLSDCEYYEVEQFYICNDPEIRLRKRTKKGEEYILTIKSKGTLLREEFETLINKEMYDRFYQLILGNKIEKRRYLKKLDNNLTAEIDFYKGKLIGLKIVEVEFADEKEALNFVPPTWFGKEVTNDSQYKNCNLSMLNNLTF